MIDEILMVIKTLRGKMSKHRELLDAVNAHLTSQMALHADRNQIVQAQDARHAQAEQTLIMRTIETEQKVCEMVRACGGMALVNDTLISIEIASSNDRRIRGKWFKITHLPATPSLQRNAA